MFRGGPGLTASFSDFLPAQPVIPSKITKGDPIDRACCPFARGIEPVEPVQQFESHPHCHIADIACGVDLFLDGNLRQMEAVQDYRPIERKLPTRLPQGNHDGSYYAGN